MKESYIGLDLGGTGIKAALVDEDGTIAARAKRVTPTAEGREGIFRAVQQVIAELLEQNSRVRGIGIGTAGWVEPDTGKVLFANNNLPGWTDMPLREAVEQAFSLPVAVENDANAAALGEGWLGAALPYRHYAMLTLGTGVGGAVVLGGRIITGGKGAAGEFGHMVLYPGGIPCSCGQRGCMEHYVSGRALGRLAAEVHPTWDGRHLLEAFAAGDTAAAPAVERYFTDLSLAAHNIQSFLDPEAIILGGGVADSHPLWLEAWKLRLAELTPLKLNLIPASLGNEAGILGAARAIMQKERI